MSNPSFFNCVTMFAKTGDLGFGLILKILMVADCLAFIVFDFKFIEV